MKQRRFLQSYSFNCVVYTKMVSAATLVQPSEEIRQKIQIEVNENVKTKDKDVAHIKEWLKQQPHLPNEWDEVSILNFLRGCNFSLEKCKRKLDMYFTMRAVCSEFFTDRDVRNSQLVSAMTKVQGAPMPVLTPNGLRVNVCRVIDKNIDPSLLPSLYKLTMMVGDIRMKEEVDGIAGDVYVLDAQLLSPTHLSLISPSIVKKFLVYVQEAYPVKLKEIHIINTNSFIEMLFNMVNPLIKEKIKSRIFFHADASSIFKYVPKEMIPEEYGGLGGSLEEMYSAWTKKLESYAPWFKEQESLVAVEALRPGKPKNYEDLFGMEGSFRQLNLD